MRRLEFEKMAKMSFLELLARTALVMSVVLWQVTTSVSLPPVSTTVTAKIVTTTKGFLCGNVTCPPGKSCDKDSAGQPECVCPTMCPMVEDPVCGSDGRTYGNECMLIVETCKNGTNVTMLHKGECNNSCDGFECLYMGLCVIGPDNRPKCDCPIIDCIRIYRPVCGSDNITYRSVCDLKMEECRIQTSIAVIYQGDCVACSQVECPFYGECTSDAPNHTTCACPFGCPKIYEPVCGCNNQTYTNECELRSDSCRTNTSITIHSAAGRCDGGSSCDGVTCPPHKHCTPNTDGKPQCVCNEKCSDVYAPVCASNGKTYSNQCEFDVALCLYDVNIMTVIHDGPCGVQDR